MGFKWLKLLLVYFRDGIHFLRKFRGTFSLDAVHIRSKCIQHANSKCWSTEYILYFNLYFTLNCLFKFKFYGPVKNFKVCHAGLLTYSYTFPRQAYSSKRLTSTCAHTFTSNWKLSFSNQSKVDQLRFHDESLRKLWAGTGTFNPWLYSHMCFVCLFVLRFYGPVNPMGSCRARSVYLTTRLLGRLSPLSG